MTTNKSRPLKKQVGQVVLNVCYVLNVPLWLYINAMQSFVVPCLLVVATKICGICRLLLFIYTEVIIYKDLLCMVVELLLGFISPLVKFVF